MARRKQTKSGGPRRDEAAHSPGEQDLRIIGGTMRGRKLAVLDRAGTRPMKHRVREAIFNLVGPDAKDRWAIDLFAGSGALGLEAISRGAQRATLIERHIPTAKIIEQNAAGLGIQDRAEVIAASAMVWVRRGPLPEGKWLVFCSPPYDFYIEREAEMLDLIERLLAAAPVGSMLVLEADERFDMERLPRPDQWDVRCYPPAVVAILRMEG